MLEIQLSPAIVEILKGKAQKYGMNFLAVFGSRVRNEAKEGSDLDILADFKDEKSLIDLIQIEEEISEALGINVDLVTYSSLYQYLKTQILNEMKVILDER